MGKCVEESALCQVEIDRSPEDFLEGDNPFVVDSAGGEAAEHIGRVIDIHCHAVRGYPMAYMHADCGDFGITNPDACMAGISYGIYAVHGKESYSGFFERANITVEVDPHLFDVDNGVNDDLAGAMKGDFSASVGFCDLHTFAGPFVNRAAQIVSVGERANGQNGRVLAEKNDAGWRIRLLFYFLRCATLKIIGGGVVDKAEIAEAKGEGFRGRRLNADFCKAFLGISRFGEGVFG